MTQRCTQCNAEVTGLKFCGDCGLKVPPPGPPPCSNCQAVMAPNAKFCGECGTPNPAYVKPAASAAASPPTEPASEPAASSSPPLSPKPSAAKRPSSVAPSTPPPPTTQSAQAQQDEAAPAHPREDEAKSLADQRTASMQSIGSAPRSDEKKKFAAKESPKCALCGKSVYKMDETTDSKGTIFHKDCLRCHQCKASLMGKEPIPEEKRAGPLKTAQYLIAKEGSDVGNKGELFCEKHAVKAKEVVSGKKADEIARDDSELSRMGALIKDKKEEARMSMEIRVGDSTPMCSRCGQPIDKGQAVLASGLQRFHEACPSKEEADKAVRSTRFFVKKAPDRLILLLTVDADTKLSFLYDIDRPLLHEQLRKKGHEPAKLIFVPDANARAAAQRRIPEAKGKRAFDVVLKDSHLAELSFTDPKTGKDVAPHVDAPNKELTVTKFHLTNGVLQTLGCKFKYDEGARVLAPEFVQLDVEMWPPVEEKADDPLAQLKKDRADTLTVEVDLAADAKASAEAALKKAHDEAAAPSASKKKASAAVTDLHAPEAAAAATAASAPEKGGGCCVIS